MPGPARRLSDKLALTNQQVASQGAVKDCASVGQKRRVVNKDCVGGPFDDVYNLIENPLPCC